MFCVLVFIISSSLIWCEFFVRPFAALRLQGVRVFSPCFASVLSRRLHAVSRLWGIERQRGTWLHFTLHITDITIARPTRRETLRPFPRLQARNSAHPHLPELHLLTHLPCVCTVAWEQSSHASRPGANCGARERSRGWFTCPHIPLLQPQTYEGWLRDHFNGAV